MFMGEYNHTIDAKGRLIIPSKFRELLGEEFVLTKGLDGCLSIFLWMNGMPLKKNSEPYHLQRLFPDQRIPVTSAVQEFSPACPVHSLSHLLQRNVEREL